MLLSIPVQLLSFASCAASSSVPYSPGQSDGNSRFFRTNRLDPRTYPAGKIAVLERARWALLTQNRSQCPSARSRSCWRHLGILGFLALLINPLNSQAPLMSPLIPGFCKDWANNYYFSGTFCCLFSSLGFCMLGRTKPSITQYPSQEPDFQIGQ